MKVVHIVLGRANPNRMNGVNRVVHNLASEQVQYGAHVSVWGITNSYNLEDELERTYHTKWFKDEGKWKVSNELLQEIKNSDATCFHLHGGFISVFYILSKLLKKYNKAFVLTPHGTYTQGAMANNTLVKSVYFKLIEKSIIKRAKSVQCLGHCEESDLKDLCKNVHTTLIPNGQNFDELKTEHEVIKKPSFIIGYCGRITMWQKGLDVLLKSFHHYKKHLQGIGELHLIGDGEYLETMENNAITLNVFDSCFFYGKKFGEEKVMLLKQMDLFVHTSRNEGLPTAVIEAAALGIPCLVSELTSMDRYVIDYNAGWTYKGEDYEHIAKLLKNAEAEYLDKTICKRGDNALKMAVDNFDWKVISKQTFNMYNA